MKSKIKKLNKKLQQFKDEATTKDKVIINLKNQNVDLIAKIIKIKGEHDQILQLAKSEFITLKKEIEKLKTQVNVQADKKITELEAKVALAKKAYDNMNDDNVVLHKVIKYF